LDILSVKNEAKLSASEVNDVEVGRGDADLRQSNLFTVLVVYYDSLLLFDKHVSEKVNKAYMMLGIIKRNFVHLSHNL